MKHFIFILLILANLSSLLFADSTDKIIGREKAQELRFTQIGKLKETIFQGKDWQLTLNVIESEYTKESIKKLTDDKKSAIYWKYISIGI